MRPLYVILFIFALAMTSCSKSSIEEEEALFEVNTNLTISTEESDLFDIINEHRESIGKNKLIFSEEAYPYAREHNIYMIDRNELSHDNFTSRASKIANVTKAIAVAENVARNYLENRQAFNGWLNSESHKKTMEGDFTHTTISIMENGNGDLYYTQIFFKK